MDDCSLTHSISPFLLQTEQTQFTQPVLVHHVLPPLEPMCLVALLWTCSVVGFSFFMSSPCTSCRYSCSLTSAMYRKYSLSSSSWLHFCYTAQASVGLHVEACFCVLSTTIPFLASHARACTATCIYSVPILPF